MLPWFASLLLLLSYNTAGLFPTDAAVDQLGTIWLLSSAEPLLTRIYPNGERVETELDMEGIPGGLAVSPTGRWAVSSPSEGKVYVYDRDDIPVREIHADDPGDLFFSGLDLWVVNTASGSLGIPGDQPAARDCAGRNTRISSGGNGRALLSGSRGVLLFEQGEPLRLIAPSGAGCFTSSGILLLQEGTLFFAGGDTLCSGLTGSWIASSQSEGPVVVWGASGISVVE